MTPASILGAVSPLSREDNTIDGTSGVSIVYVSYVVLTVSCADAASVFTTAFVDYVISTLPVFSLSKTRSP
ncbi:hypothetical protein PC129_g25515 [Phytophthora cactorum]|uniref:Uncharacterized protein n=1 Tax=Phytophthora cactorum TaxID=29920 RepID=A0A8T1IX49_9STRA|nr:hypothetical protein PC111_g25417 [Phytophthora cactorum]KAG2758745.1 hypothetical protein PC112_g25921 [Phytophthora cactorum]KAG2791432.1 hypothetical protein PC113_g25837 [Phytophthora cactorum]KAG2850575.1 hypothetical protein PC114_g28921 [Phytophthora cactorum]KAG2850920.1 hypothetical protein PC115_g26046 [Phytophthora cactorum]